MPKYVRKDGLRPIHLVADDGTLRCRRDIDASGYEPIEPDDRDWENICIVCTRVPSDLETYWEGKVKNRKDQAAIGRANKKR